MNLPMIGVNEDLFLVYDHEQFYVERKGFEPRNIYEYLEIKKQIIKYKNTPGPIEELEDDLKGYFDYESQYWIFQLMLIYIQEFISH